jgi:uncharacterized membrane protein YesL
MVQPRHGIGFYSERNPMNSEKKNPLFSFLNLLGQLILLSILWTVCCLPVITVGASTVALYYTVVKVLRRNQDSLFAAFFREFRNNFLQSLNINMVFLCYFGILAYFAIPRLSAAQSGADIGFYALVGLAILGALPLSFVYPTISRFYHKGGALVRFLLMVIGKHPHIVLGCTLLLAAGILLVLSNPAALLFVPGVVCYVQSLLLEPVFRKYSAADSDPNYEMWYGDTSRM